MHFNSNDVLHRTTKPVSKFMWKQKQSRIANVVRSRKSNIGDDNAWSPIMLQNHSDKDNVALIQSRYLDQQYRIEDPTIVT